MSHFRVNTDNENSKDEIIRILTQKVAAYEEQEKAISKIFSPEQMKKLTASGRKLKWSIDDISKAIVLYSGGPRAYRLLLKKGYPFPAVSTLKDWLKKIKISPGILTNVLHIIKLSDLNAFEKVCVILFDEMKIRKAYSYDRANDQTLDAFNYVQVVMIRGLFGSWKQPVFFDYDCMLTRKILFDIITFVENSGNL